jgi:DNA-binding SARP family transcriptional activator
MLRVEMLGVFRVAGADGKIWAALGPAGRGLASFLFTYPGRPHRRERLADLFWPELDAERARRALNSAVWRLRKLLAPKSEPPPGEVLHTIGSETILDTAQWLDIDAAALQDAGATIIRQPEALADPEVLNRVVSVLRRYSGPFLDGDDGDWVLEERERLHSLFLRTATEVVRQLGAVGRYDDAISLARGALHHDPYREEMVRYLLALLALAERRCEAIQYFQSWSRGLRVELDIAPLPETARLLDEIRRLDSPDGLQRLRAILSGHRS